MWTSCFWQVHRVKAKELEDLKKSYKESMDELITLRTKVCDGDKRVIVFVRTRSHLSVFSSISQHVVL